MRPFARADEFGVLELINADQVPGQPEVTAAQLAEAVAGRSPNDSGWWEELDAPVTVVAVEGGAVVGVVSFAVRAKDRTGLILWLHCREREDVAAALVAYAVDALAGCARLEAFTLSSALVVALEGLPVRHRAVTHEALLAAGFVGADLWAYMRAELPLSLPRLDAGVRYERMAGDEWELSLMEGRTRVAKAQVGLPVAGTGVLWWISTRRRARGRGYGRVVLGAAGALLADLGAREVVLVVDDDAPEDQGRSRVAAKRMYRGAGFVEVDRLFSYTRHGGDG
ncbi:hypothetical protein BIV57_21575 [Mangrovactinospora gilvigrisea]|uniref:N-acetyltransferase domain-containing protein n=2 Tax=Mangrovactinospora gilvigrisea TaxID=1428644 RepID=A0A1J7B9V8_9ACTN|nr:hypothetical protein BIV57_21575 [Mangrovactinospora gilvigrisea]